MNARFRTFHSSRLSCARKMKKLDHISKARDSQADSLNFSGRGCFLRYKESSGSSRRAPEELTLPLSGHIVRNLLAHTRGELKGKRASATLLRQHLRFGTHERYKPTSIGGKAACERER